MLFITKYEQPEDALKNALMHHDELPAKEESPDHEANVLGVSLNQHAAMTVEHPAAVLHTQNERSELQRFQQLLAACFAGFQYLIPCTGWCESPFGISCSASDNRSIDVRRLSEYPGSTLQRGFASCPWIAFPARHGRHF